MMKTIKEINEKIRRGEAVVVRADEMPEIYEENPERAAREVDIVTTGTFGVMCSSGAFLNFGHSDPPIKMQRVWLNDVEAYTGIAAVDAYIGATQASEDRGIEYGGGHVIEDLVAGKEVSLSAKSSGTDCYPRKKVDTTIALEDLNQAYMLNPRNCFQKYNAAVNSTNAVLQTYMGTLLPNKRNINFAGTGEISPLVNDPCLETIGVGSGIFLCGAKGMIIGEGTQSSPKTGFANLATKGDLKEMSTKYLAGASIRGYGASIFIGVGIPIPILNEGIAKATAIRDRDVKTQVLDYGVPRLSRPAVCEVSYEELFSGKVELDGRRVRTSPLSSRRVSFDIMDELGRWIKEKEFYLSEPVKALPRDSQLKPMRLKQKSPFVKDVMTKRVITAYPGDTIDAVSKKMVKREIDQVPIVDPESNKVVGIVTSWDITKAVAQDKKTLEQIMSRNIITSMRHEFMDAVRRRCEKHKISSTPVVDEEGRLVGIITISDIIRSDVERNKKR